MHMSVFPSAPLVSLTRTVFPFGFDEQIEWPLWVFDSPLQTCMLPPVVCPSSPWLIYLVLFLDLICHSVNRTLTTWSIPSPWGICFVPFLSTILTLVGWPLRGNRTHPEWTVHVTPWSEVVALSAPAYKNTLKYFLCKWYFIFSPIQL